jgi:hypothetical protein
MVEEGDDVVDRVDDPPARLASGGAVPGPGVGDQAQAATGDGPGHRAKRRDRSRGAVVVDQRHAVLRAGHVDVDDAAVGQGQLGHGRDAATVRMVML